MSNQEPIFVYVGTTPQKLDLKSFPSQNKKEIKESDGIFGNFIVDAVLKILGALFLWFR